MIFLLTFIALLLLPGYFLAALIAPEMAWFQRLPVAFSLSLALLGLPAILMLNLHAPLALLGWLALALNLLFGSIHFWQKRKNNPGRIRPQILFAKFKSLVINPLFLTCLAVVGLSLYIFARTAVVRDFGDHWFYLQFIRHYLNFPLDPALNPLVNQDVTPGTLSRAATNGWWVIQALIVQVSGAPLLDAYWLFLPPILMVSSILAFYALAWELFEKQQAALTAVLLQLLLHLTTISSHDWIGQGFFTRIAEDKYLVWLILLPISFMLLLRYSKTKQWRFLLLLGVSVTAIAITHPFGLLQFAFAAACFAIIHLPPTWKERTRMKTAVLLAPILLFLIIPVVQQFFSGTTPFTQFNTAELQTPPNETHLIVQSAVNNRYLLHPHLIFQPLILLAILLTPILLIKIKRSTAVQFLFATTALPLLLLYNPITAPLLGRFLSPLLLWRALWIMPASLTLAYFLNGLTATLQARLGRPKYPQWIVKGATLLPIICLLLFSFILRAYLADGLDLLDDYKTRAVTTDQQDILNYLCQEHDLDGIVIANPTMNTLLPSCAPSAKLLTYRIFQSRSTAAEEIDQFYQSSVISRAGLAFLERWQAEYLIIPNQVPIAAQTARLPEIFTEQFSNASYSLYEIHYSENPIIQGNKALIRGDDLLAKSYFQQALSQTESDTLAYFGLGQVALAQGKTAEAENAFQQAIDADPVYPAPYIALTNLRTPNGRPRESLSLLNQALTANPNSLIIHQSLAELYIESGDETAVYEQLRLAIPPTTNARDESLALGSLLQEYGLIERAITIYETVIEEESSLFNLSGGPGFWPVWSRSLTFDRRPERLEAAYLALGQIYEAKGDLTAAETAYRQIIRLLPAREKGYRSLATLFTNNNRLEEVITLYDEASQLNFHLTWPHLSLAKACLSQYQKNDGQTASLEKARAAIEAAQKIDPGNIESYHLLAQLYKLDNQPQAIETLYQEAAERFYWADWPLVSLGQIYLDNADFPLAQSMLEAAISRQPTQQTAYNLLGEAYINRQETDKAIEIYQQAINQNPSRAWPYLGLGNAYLAAGQNELALTALQDGLSREPDNAAVYSTLGNIYRWNVGDQETAVRYFRRSLAIEPANADVLMALGATLISTGQETTGLPYIAQALATLPITSTRFQTAGDIMWQTARTELAQGYYEQALEIDHQNAFAHLGLSRIYRQAQQYQPALEQAEQAVQYGQSVHVIGPAQQEQAQIYLALGQPEQALPHLQAAAAALPADPWFQASLGDYYHYQENDPTQAVPYYQKAAELAPQQAILQAALGTALYDAGQIPEALIFMEQAVALDGGNAAIYLRIGSVFNKFGDWERLVQFYETAVENGIQNPDIFTQLGNAYSALGQEALADVQYEKAAELQQ